MFNESSRLVIKHLELQLDKELGKGGFGVVFRGNWRHNEVAVKQLLMDNISPEAAEEFIKEAKIMAELRSPNIVQFYGYCVSPHYCIVMEYMPEGSLFHLLRSNKPLGWPTQFNIAIDIAKGLSYLHHEKILHRDIKSLNVLLGENYKAKLTDFGLSKVKTETRFHSMATKNKKESVGTLGWMAPELFARKPVFTQKSDIYSLAMTFWELASKKIPFEDAASQDLIPKWVSEGEREEIPKDCPSSIASLIESCWHKEPDKRPDADTVVVQLKTARERLSENLPNPSTSNNPQYEDNFHSVVNSGPQYQNNLNSGSLGKIEILPSSPEKKNLQLASDKTTKIPSTILMLMGFEETLALAKQGDARAQFRIGFFYRNGIGCTKDDVKAVEWYEKAALQGNGCAMVSLGSMYEIGDSDSLKKDSGRALKYYQDAFEKLMSASDDVFVQNSLGIMYQHGLGVVKDEKKAFIWYEKSAQQGYMNAQCNFATMYLNGLGVVKDEKKAFIWYEKSAQQGYMYAQCNFAIMYLNGVGTIKDEKQAFFWYEKAAQQENIEAQAQLGYMYLKGLGTSKNEKQAFFWSEKAVQQGYMQAQVQLGYMYENGEGTVKDIKQAIIYYERAAQQGDARAQYFLGEMYEIGQNVPKNEQQAFIWFMEAAKQGVAKAQTRVGVMYLYGIGVVKDEQQAFMWLNKAAQQEDTNAQNNLGVIYQKGLGVVKDEQQAFMWYEKAAQQGHMAAQFALAGIYLNGWGIAKDIRQAFILYERAANQGLAEAQNTLGVMYLTGQEIVKDEQKAFFWFEKAAEQGYMSGQHNLALMYLHGQGIAKDERTASYWFQEAAKRGDPDANKYLGWMYQGGNIPNVQNAL